MLYVTMLVSVGKTLEIVTTVQNTTVNNTNVTYNVTSTKLVGVCADSYEEALIKMDDRVVAPQCSRVITGESFTDIEKRVVDICKCGTELCRQDQYCTSDGCESCPCGDHQYKTFDEETEFYTCKDRLEHCSPGEFVLEEPPDQERTCQYCPEKYIFIDI